MNNIYNIFVVVVVKFKKEQTNRIFIMFFIKKKKRWPHSYESIHSKYDHDQKNAYQMLY